MFMRATLLAIAASVLLAAAITGLRAQAPAPVETPSPAQGVDDRGRTTGPVPLPKAAGSWSELMIDVIYPASNDLFYIYREPPANDVEWNKIRMSAMALAEAGNALMTKGRGYDDDMWLRDARLMVDAGIAAYEAAKRKDAQAIADLNDQIYNSCIVCHGDYRSAYGQRPLAGSQ